MSRLSVVTDPRSEVNTLRWQDHDDVHPCKLLHSMSKSVHNTNTATYVDDTYDLVNEWTLVHDYTLVASMIGVYDSWSNSVLVLDLVMQCDETKNVCISFCYGANQGVGDNERLSRLKKYARYTLRVLIAQYGMPADGCILVVGPDSVNFNTVD